MVEAFIDELDLAGLGSAGMVSASTGRPAYHPSTLLKIYLYGYLNRVQSSRRLGRETQRNVELMWLAVAIPTMTSGARLATARRLPTVPTRGGIFALATLARR